MCINKVKKFCDHSMILWEMAGDLPTNGLNQPPPMSFRVKSSWINNIQFTSFQMWNVFSLKLLVYCSLRFSWYRCGTKIMLFPMILFMFFKVNWMLLIQLLSMIFICKRMNCFLGITFINWIGPLKLVGVVMSCWCYNSGRDP